MYKHHSNILENQTLPSYSHRTWKSSRSSTYYYPSSDHNLIISISSYIRRPTNLGCKLKVKQLWYQWTSHNMGPKKYIGWLHHWRLKIVLNHKIMKKLISIQGSSYHGIPPSIGNMYWSDRGSVWEVSTSLSIYPTIPCVSMSIHTIPMASRYTSTDQ